uniref:VWFC domain-containing protein n=1 Tax=Cyprinodon variegatus TaxID=28743 RepID=A0A3Q2DST2_CYPVA
YVILMVLLGLHSIFYEIQNNPRKSFSHPTDSCQTCNCNNGTVRCQHRPCPFEPCSHPITRDCCRTCERMHPHLLGSQHEIKTLFLSTAFNCSFFPAGCLYQDRERANGETWNDPSDPCTVCVCQHGSVRCERKRCPDSNCNHPCLHPVPSGTCCPECDSCLYEGVVHSNGHTFTSLSNPCERCTCFRGTVSCGPLNCPLTRCERPVLEPGECCPHCTDSRESCLYQGTMYKSDEQWEVDECTSCTCVSGDVHCRSQRCPAFSCAPVS